MRLLHSAEKSFQGNLPNPCGISLLRSCPARVLRIRELCIRGFLIVFHSCGENEKIKIPLPPFKKGGTCSPFYEGGWGDLNTSAPPGMKALAQSSCLNS